MSDDLYSTEGIDELQDYWNAYMPLFHILMDYGAAPDDLLREALARREPVLAVVEYYEVYYHDCPASCRAGMDAEIAAFPSKVSRLGKLAAFTNAATDAVSLKRAINEVRRILYGRKERLMYPEEQFKPDLLALE